MRVMNLALITINALIPSIGMLSGLSAAFTVPVCFIILLWQTKGAKFNRINISRIAMIFIFWCFCSCFWSIDPIQSFKLFVRVFGLVFICLLLMRNINHLQINDIFLGLGIGITVAVTYFFIEYATNGIITNNFKTLFSKNSSNIFHLYNLDRGCTILSLVSWLIIYNITNNLRHILAIAYYALIFYILLISESLASFVGFTLGSIIFILIRAYPRLAINLIKYSIIIGSLAMPTIAYKMNPKAIADNYSMPLSAKHRLFIWHYVAEKAWEKPLFGYGFGSSKHFTVQEEEYVSYNNQKWSPLPLHPHNNIMQILLETGIIGLLLFLGVIYQFFSIVIKKLYLNKINHLYIAALIACFVNYYVISMISFSIWQSWWVCIGAWLVLIFRWRNNKNLPLPNYSQLCTQYYDLDKSNAPVDALAYYLNHASQAKGPILEPMSGSGRFQIPLLQKGYEIIGFDNSPAMIEACQKKCIELGIGTTNKVFLASFADFIPTTTYKLIFIPSGSFCLLIEKEEIDQALKFINKYLANDGKFIFEVDSIAAKNKNLNVWQQNFVTKLDGNKIILHSFSQFNENTKIETTICRYELQQDGKIIKEETEHFKVKLYEDTEIESLLKNCNFKVINKYQPYINELPDDQTETVVYECMKLK